MSRNQTVVDLAATLGVTVADSIF